MLLFHMYSDLSLYFTFVQGPPGPKGAKGSSVSYSCSYSNIPVNLIWILISRLIYHL